MSVEMYPMLLMVALAGTTGTMIVGSAMGWFYARWMDRRLAKRRARLLIGRMGMP